MTQREFFEAIVRNQVNAEVIAFAKESIAKLNAQNEKRRNTPNKIQKENAPIKEAIFELLKNGALVASEIADNLGITTQKASALCRQLVEENKVSVSEIKIPKKGTVKSYTVK